MVQVEWPFFACRATDESLPAVVCLPLFARVQRLYDVIRKAYGDFYNNLSEAQVSQYLHFDLIDNDQFLHGSRGTQDLTLRAYPTT